MGAEGPLDFDADAMRERYRQERDKRVRDDGVGQYVDLSGALAHMGDTDPYVEPGFTRDPVAVAPDVVIIGGGFSGCLLYTSPSPRDATLSRMPSSA